MPLTPRELATVLAALRDWQAAMEAMEDAEFAEWAADTFWFDGHEPLSPAEIADLCDRLDTGEPMKSGSLSSYRAAGAFGTEDPDDEQISDAMLIRQWWYVYLWTLRDRARDMSQLNELTAECERRRIVRRGVPMPRTGAEDLAEQCDRAREFKP